MIDNKEDLLKVYKKIDRMVSTKDIEGLRKEVKLALESDDKRRKQVVYQYASLFRSEIIELRELEAEIIN